jgi:hypothetical protein
MIGFTYSCVIASEREATLGLGKIANRVFIDVLAIGNLTDSNQIARFKGYFVAFAPRNDAIIAMRRHGLTAETSLGTQGLLLNDKKSLKAFLSLTDTAAGDFHFEKTLVKKFGAPGAVIVFARARADYRTAQTRSSFDPEQSRR